MITQSKAAAPAETAESVLNLMQAAAVDTKASCTDQNLAQQHLLSRPDREHQETVVYRHYDAGGNLLYVGISWRPGARQASHEQQSAWYSQVASTTYQRYATRSQAEAEEVRTILACKPRYNRNSGIKKHTDKSASSAIYLGMSWCLPHRERVLATLKAADRPLSFEAVRKLTHGSYRLVTLATNELIRAGVLVEAAGPRNARLVVLADSTHLLRELKNTSRAIRPDLVRERVIATVRKAGEAMSFACIGRQTYGGYHTIARETNALIRAGVLVEAAGPRNARLVSLASC